MSRLKNLFEKKNTRVLNLYCTAGYPNLDSTVPIMQALTENGADIIELGMPYSDPLADGPVIQHSSMIALKNGMNINVLFRQLKEFREKQQHIPVVLMGYLNPILQFGFENFCREAKESGVDGLIIPDIPPHIFEREFRSTVIEHGLDFIFLIAPETSIDRMRMLDELSSGFLYAVSSSSTTGEKSKRADTKYLELLHNMKFRNPVLVGFGIKDRSGVDEVSRYVNGAIIGSALIRSLENEQPPESSVKQFMNGLFNG